MSYRKYQKQQINRSRNGPETIVRNNPKKELEEELFSRLRKMGMTSAAIYSSGDMQSYLQFKDLASCKNAINLLDDAKVYHRYQRMKDGRIVGNTIYVASNSSGGTRMIL